MTDPKQQPVVSDVPDADSESADDQMRAALEVEKLRWEINNFRLAFVVAACTAVAAITAAAWQWNQRSVDNSFLKNETERLEVTKIKLGNEIVATTKKKDENDSQREISQGKLREVTEALGQKTEEYNKLLSAIAAETKTRKDSEYEFAEVEAAHKRALTRLESSRTELEQIISQGDFKDASRAQTFTAALAALRAEQDRIKSLLLATWFADTEFIPLRDGVAIGDKSYVVGDTLPGRRGKVVSSDFPNGFEIEVSGIRFRIPYAVEGVAP